MSKSDHLEFASWAGYRLNIFNTRNVSSGTKEILSSYLTVRHMNAFFYKTLLSFNKRSKSPSNLIQQSKIGKIGIEVWN